MRFAAVHDGQGGSVDHPVAAGLTPAGAATGKPPMSPVLLGDLVVMPPLAPEKPLMLPFEPRVRGDGLVGFTQVLIDHRARVEWKFLFDVVQQEQGAAILRARGTFDLSVKGRAGTVQADFDVRCLPPGDYLMRLTAAAGGPPLATLVAPFTLERAAPSPTAVSK